MTDPGLLKWTGHALVDVGIAGVCAFVQRKRPEAVTLEDLDRVGDFIEETYYAGKLGTYLTCVFMNSSFVQPKEGVETRTAFVTRYVRAHRASPDPIVEGQCCVFSGTPATSPLVRTHFPLFSGEGVINFRPSGTTWIPAAGPYIVATLFLPMASRRAEGKLLAVHADAPALTMQFARRYLDDNRRLLALALPTNRALVHATYEREICSWDTAKKVYKYGDVKGPRSLVVADLVEIGAEAGPTWTRSSTIGITAYLLSNSGQGPSLDVFSVPGGVVSFILRAAEPATRAAWQAVTRKFRPVKAADSDGNEELTLGDCKKRGAREAPPAGRPGWSKNPAFEDLCAIFDAGFIDRPRAAAWLRRHLLGRLAGERARFQDTQARDWKLAQLFLEEVLRMKAARIDAIRTFADKIAQWVQRKNDRRLLGALVRERPWLVRQALMRAQRQSAQGADLLFGMNEYATVWLHEDGDEALVRDLICIRVVEQLAGSGYFQTNPSDLPEAGQEPESIQETIQ